MIEIAGRKIGSGFPAYFVAEISANHGQDYERAARAIEAAKAAGADAVKLQTYTANTLTIDARTPWFRIEGGLWAGRTLHDLYLEAYTPWEWHPRLKQVADDLGIHLFSTPFDRTAVELLESLQVPAHKIASFELVDTRLLECVARTGKPVILSTGMATLAEIDEAVATLRAAGCQQLALLKCTSAYPASPEQMNLRTIPHLAEAFGVVAGLSDHTLDIAVPVAAITLGACIVEKHFTLSRAAGGPDAAFSLEPDELKATIQAIRMAEQALGTVHYGVSEAEAQNRAFRRSLFVVEDVKAGELFTEQNVRSIRPGYGLAPRHLPDVLNRRAACDIARGTPLTWQLVAS